MKDQLNDNTIEGLSDDEEKKVILFGRDVSDIPCFRETFLTSILGGIGCGLLTFISTSKIMHSTNMAVYSFGGITLTYWIYCRYNWSLTKFNAKRATRLMENFDEIEEIKRKFEDNKPR